MDLKLSDSGDIVIENGLLVFVTGTESIAQHMAIRFRTILGEWFLDTRIGVPYFGKVIGVKNPNLSLVKALLSRVARETPGVDQVTRLDLDYDPSARTLAVTVGARDVDGEPVVIKDLILSDAFGG